MSDLCHTTFKGRLTHATHTTKWWCPTCRLLVDAEDNPVLCDECGGDMTIAPMSQVIE